MRISLSFLLLPVAASGFFFAQPMAIKQGLVQVTDSQKTTPLTIKLDVGITDDARLNIQGLMLELSSKEANYEHPKMPGADGPHPQLSSGVRTLNILKEGSFVDMNGQKTVKTLNGCWEMVWKQNASAGSLICGFDIPEEYSRNDASLDAGRLYLSFPIWTKIGLKEAQEQKEFVMSRTKELMNEKNEHMAKYQADHNPLMKALHYRNAVAAVEKNSFLDLKSVDMVPSSDDIIPLQDDLLLTTKGLVFSKDGSFHRGRHLLLGAAYAGPVEMRP
eukprot:CAMPEP_0119008880 /NCGR_PEP_ID=MMETSP1176-20130426/4000_1 /TAXON_ID=265551 /ORGANISM="Synedropsis recta cf, Strain CCMP1620" /LENGTH=274 /DNA_ID=CAMNT_0006961291 /DNA_START=65 /DNA_END=889 /DNA_ORIENTATION=+